MFQEILNPKKKSKLVVDPSHQLGQGVRDVLHVIFPFFSSKPLLIQVSASLPAGHSSHDLAFSPLNLPGEHELHEVDADLSP